jgi:hypothetical protein
LQLPLLLDFTMLLGLQPCHMCDPIACLFSVLVSCRCHFDFCPATLRSGWVLLVLTLNSCHQTLNPATHHTPHSTLNEPKSDWVCWCWLERCGCTSDQVHRCQCWILLTSAVFSPWRGLESMMAAQPDADIHIRFTLV